MTVGPIDVTDPLVAARVVEIQRAAYAVEAALIGFDGIPPLHETAADVAALTELEWIGSHRHGTLVGIAGWSLTDDTLHIDRVAVHPDFARSGHGSALLWAIPPTQLVTVSTGRDNTPARAFYERHGFTWVGDREVVPGLLISNYQRRKALTDRLP
ncbi:MAG: GNAT family N-acetyltransferase [Acidimicrobiia bacterium]|nr:GNAT family N-acetyltransferase [Acidimicrobiia bacterium]